MDHRLPGRTCRRRRGNDRPATPPVEICPDQPARRGFTLQGAARFAARPASRSRHPRAGSDGCADPLRHRRLCTGSPSRAASRTRTAGPWDKSCPQPVSGVTPGPWRSDISERTCADVDVPGGGVHPSAGRDTTVPLREWLATVVRRITMGGFESVVGGSDGSGSGCTNRRGGKLPGEPGSRCKPNSVRSTEFGARRVCSPSLLSESPIRVCSPSLLSESPLRVCSPSLLSESVTARRSIFTPAAGRAEALWRPAVETRYPVRLSLNRRTVTRPT